MFKVKSLMFNVMAMILVLNIAQGTLNKCFAQDKPSSGDLLSKARKAHGEYNVEDTFKYTQQCIDLYKDEADKEQASLADMPKKKTDIEAVQVLNDVATCYFIQAEAYMRQGKFEEAKKAFESVKNDYKNSASAREVQQYLVQLN